MFKVFLKNNKNFVCSSQDSILIGAQKSDLNLNYSCQTGKCKTCKAKVISGTSIPKSAEIGLSDDEINEGYILTCVRIPTSDITLNIEDLSEFKIEIPKIIPSKIDRLEKISKEIMRLDLRLPPNVNIKFLEGQYVNIIKDDYQRSYSIANCNVGQKLEFYIKFYESGKFSDYIFNKAKINDLLRIEAPMGTFFYRKTLKKNIIFLATGTGIAPIKAILEHFNQNKDLIKNKNIYLFFGGRTPENFFWTPLHLDIVINFTPVLSQKNKNWNGEYGYVQNVLLAKNIDLYNAEVYACGSNNMIEDASHLLFKNHLSENSFFSDAFVTTN